MQPQHTSRHRSTCISARIPGKWCSKLGCDGRYRCPATSMGSPNRIRPCSCEAHINDVAERSKIRSSGHGESKAPVEAGTKGEMETVSVRALSPCMDGSGSCTVEHFLWNVCLRRGWFSERKKSTAQTNADLYIASVLQGTSTGANGGVRPSGSTRSPDTQWRSCCSKDMRYNAGLWHHVYCTK